MPPLRPLSRRTLLTESANAAAAAARPLLLDRIMAPPSPLRRARSMADQVLPTRIVGPPPLPPLSVIAFNRLGFGPRPQDWAAWQALGAGDDARLTAYVDQQLDPDAIDDSDCDARIATAGFTTLDKPLAQLWADHVTNNDPFDWGLYILPFDETYHVTWLRAIYSERQLFETLVDFWHNHFNVYASDEAAPAFVHYDRDVIRAHALGNFRTLLEAVGASTTMLYYLDNVHSYFEGPNENYARELFELHTMGADNYLGHTDPADVPLDDQGRPIAYVEQDVYAAARAFTGWTVDDAHWTLPGDNPGLFLIWNPWHDFDQKQVLGQTLPAGQGALADGQTIFDLLAEHPATARHVCSKLCRRLVADNPPQSVIDAAVAAWTANLAAPDQLRQVVRAILLSDEFKTTWGQKVKRPFEFTAAMLRAMQAEWVPDWGWSFYWWYSALGQRLFEWPAPDGHPDTQEPWISTNVMLRRWNITIVAVEGWMESAVQIDILSQMPADLRTPNEIVDWWMQRIMGREINAEDHAKIVEFMAQGRNPDYDLPLAQIEERLPRLVELICMAPDFQYR